MGDHDQLEKAFAGATVHDMFNYMTVAILFPVELATQYLARITALCVKNASTEKGEEWEVRIYELRSTYQGIIMAKNYFIYTNVAISTRDLLKKSWHPWRIE
jgi:solute carrier family 34 (sodium-dependent phosphate cotransporter)